MPDTRDGRDDGSDHAPGHPPQRPDGATLVRLRRQGRTLAEIAQEFGTTASGVWLWLSEVPPEEWSSPRDPEEPQSVEKMTGWTIAARHRDTEVMRHLETFIRRRQGLAVGEDETREAIDWIADLNDVGAVIDYHPEAPPNDLSREGGFFLRRREREDKRFFRRHEAPPEQGAPRSATP